MKNTSVLLISATLGLTWLRSSWAKFSSHNFAGELGATLAKFASKNPHGTFKNILETIAIPNSVVLGNIVMWGELLVALTLTGVSLYVLVKREMSPLLGIVLCFGLLGGVILNVLFWFASGWMSPAADNLNLLMAVVQIIIGGGIAKGLLFKKDQKLTT